jgi:hypothetical protein
MEYLRGISAFLAVKTRNSRCRAGFWILSGSKKISEQFLEF